MRRIGMTAAAVVLGLGLLGCSSDDDAAEPADSTTTTTTEAPSSSAKDGFVEAANAICSEMDDRSVELSDSMPEDGAESAADMQRLLEGNAQLAEEAIAQIRALPQPPEDAARLEAMYAQIDELAALGRQGATAVAQGDEATFATVSEQADELSAKANAAFTEYGLDVCGSA
ncbi:hypothetical protein [Dermatobacter hominis]|uniref:hypothetical protein n=1 Tax=Dermatobacter hominis TaxID=2884263 RepID=UPI001D10D994|nr:hypothetical protein [Dermatobacter hominis]UDY35881.1 hypothetical protein LH044_21505 [Dermatobacter hominis]